jgi:hypothetical protein
MKKWKIVKKMPPPIDNKFWGYDSFYKQVLTCIWDGKRRTDEGDPFPIDIINGGDDYFVTHWMEIEPEPAPPNVQYEGDITDD